ncbi:MAG TPA: thioesterase family protein [Nocardioides sp.]|uniref:acyl-CoA thioesterase n=1 Tax=Nocardioides sp. TaxID=35761 RepID=UPI002D7E792B|nr:thioesterase family protein [Nocardioides sp.]HET6654000.1 thioesterase family protein [Nocardioides sp.]
MPHEYTCHVRFSDVDVYGHVNNVKYFEYYQEARIDFLRSMRTDDEPHLATVVARIDVDYRRPILFRPEPYVVRTWVTRVGTSSYSLASDISDDHTVLSRAQAVLVAFDMSSQRSRPLRDLERQVLEGALEPA